MKVYMRVASAAALGMIAVIYGSMRIGPVRTLFKRNKK